MTETIRMSPVTATQWHEIESFKGPIYLQCPCEGTSKGHEVFSQQALWMTICGYRKSTITGHRRKECIVKFFSSLKITMLQIQDKSHCKVGCVHKRSTSKLNKEVILENWFSNPFDDPKKSRAQVPPSGQP